MVTEHFEEVVMSRRDVATFELGHSFRSHVFQRTFLCGVVTNHISGYSLLFFITYVIFLLGKHSLLNCGIHIPLTAEISLGNAVHILRQQDMIVFIN